MKFITYASKYLYERGAYALKAKGYTAASTIYLIDGRVEVRWVK
jgi:hypothetical protein